MVWEVECSELSQDPVPGGPGQQWGQGPGGGPGPDVWLSLLDHPVQDTPCPCGLLEDPEQSCGQWAAAPGPISGRAPPRSGVRVPQTQQPLPEGAAWLLRSRQSPPTPRLSGDHVCGFCPPTAAPHPRAGRGVWPPSLQGLRRAGSFSEPEPPGGRGGGGRRCCCRAGGAAGAPGSFPPAPPLGRPL